MEACTHESSGALERFAHHDHMALLGPAQGGRAGCRAGVLYYRQTAYLQGGVHDDQEGFYVLEGTGAARVGEVEFPLSPGSCFLAPPGVYHAIRRDETCPWIKLFYFHASAEETPGRPAPDTERSLSS